jgi:hypothetical protein
MQPSPPVTSVLGPHEMSRRCVVGPAVAVISSPMTKLVREVPCRRMDRIGTMLRLTLVAFAAVLVAGTLVDLAEFSSGGSKLDVARLTIRKYAREAYPRWRAAHPGQTCPAQLVDLNVYMNNRDTKDPYGNDYEMYCGLHGIVVRSLGEDGRLNTEDDLWSNL